MSAIPLHTLAALLLAGSNAAPAPVPAPRAQDSFDSVWYDGKAEVCGYQWHGTRYGELRSGKAVAILVTEPFGEIERVKIDRPADAEGPVVSALKLNLVRDFQTGIYDYHTITSLFLRAGSLAPMKVAFSGSEWCGQVYEEVLPDEHRTRLDLHSYFQGESGEHDLEAHPDGLIGEQVLVWARGLHGDPLEPGGEVELPFLPGSFERRLRHVPAEWGTLHVARDAEPRRVGVPAGVIDVTTYRATASDGRSLVVDVAAEAPHRIVRWSWSRDDTLLDEGELSGWARLAYWERHAEGDEALLRTLGF